MELSLALLLLAVPVPVTREVYLMGTRSVLTTYAQTEESGRQQLEKYLRLLEETENELSVWRPDTALSGLNATPVGQRFRAGERLFTLLREVRRWWRDTDGAFDAAIGKILAARGFYGLPSVPSPEKRASGIFSGMQHLQLEERTMEVIRVEDVWLDSGAFGKGEALDRVRKFAEAEGTDPWMIDLGGQVMVYRSPPAEAAWPVDIAHPEYRNAVVMTLELDSGSVAVSGNSERPGHILDPRTGLPVEFAGSVVVWHQRGLVADILATALFVMGPERGWKWAEPRAVAACFLESKEKIEMRATSAFLNRFGRCR